MVLHCECVFVGKGVKAGVKDPTKMNYMVSVVQDEEVASVLCASQEVYESICKEKLYSPIVLAIDYSVKYGSIKALGVVK